MLPKLMKCKIMGSQAQGLPSVTETWAADPIVRPSNNTALRLVCPSTRTPPNS